MDDAFVILVDIDDSEIGVSEKMEAHHKALLHRAISIFIFNSKGDYLLQRRALKKYHSKGLWSNTCCTHPFPDESIIDAANRRLMDEMGMKCQLNELFSFTYKEVLDNELTEHEFDHVFLGITDEVPKINTDEVMSWKYISYHNLLNDIKYFPTEYTVWFKKIFEEVNSHL